MAETGMSPFEIFLPAGEMCKDLTLDVSINSKWCALLPVQGGNNWNVTFPYITLEAFRNPNAAASTSL